ncbi:putative receptor-like protein kinase At3g47110 [Quercus robur]|uniref:putative receptor-like protein kinase At3g47110 n=1 Tax=Quercus robur TaxID=38942 RepID=UPI002161936E|nr:putative receptor-like protein kinase At3g47110 [Quercus robur]
MSHSCLSSKWLLQTFYHGILLMCISSNSKSSTVLAFANETDRLALVDFKNRITQDPLQIMSSWNDTIHFCNWLGVTCSPSCKRVTVLDLKAKKLVGFITPSIRNLTYLTGINLQNNSFYGEIPQEVGCLLRLQYLNLTWNSFGGKIPTNLSYCTQLEALDVAENEFIGRIPDHLSSLSKLVFLSLGQYNLVGTIPAWIGNFSSLNVLSLGPNNFQGNTPSELGRLSGLGFFQVSENNIADVGLTLPNLKNFWGGSNLFTGPIPLSFSNSSHLRSLDLGQNGLTGTVPQNLASLQSLEVLSFDGNSLGKGIDGDLNFLSYLANCTFLKGLGLHDNYFGGVLPNSIANLSTQLRKLTLGTNMIHGGIPIGIGNLVNLQQLGLEYNYLGGTLPDVTGNLQKLNIDCYLCIHSGNSSGSINDTCGPKRHMVDFVARDNGSDESLQV